MIDMKEIAEIRKILEEAMPDSEYGAWKIGLLSGQEEEADQFLEVRAQPFGLKYQENPLEMDYDVWCGLFVCKNKIFIPNKLLVPCVWYKGFIYDIWPNWHFIEDISEEVIGDAISQALSYGNGFYMGLSHSDFNALSHANLDAEKLSDKNISCVWAGKYLTHSKLMGNDNLVPN